MKTTIKTISLVALIGTVLFSCKKNDTGGKAEIHAKISHHSAPINGSTVYVKFGTQELPTNPTSNYDLKIEGEATDNHVHIKDLRYGEYYLYAVGFDSAIGQTVKGGVPITIKWSERKKTIDIDIPVTE
jgi:hypothetical protein